MDKLLENVLSAITEDDAALVDVEQLGKIDRKNAFFTFVVNAGVKTKLVDVELFKCLYYERRRLEVELVAVQIVHNACKNVLKFLFCCKIRHKKRFMELFSLS